MTALIGYRFIRRLPACVTGLKQLAVASGFFLLASGALTAANNTFASTTVTLSVINGNCVANYTFSQQLPNVTANIALGANVTIVFLVGTDATMITSGTFNGTAIAMGTVTNPTTNSLSFTAPVAVSGAGTTFTIVINGVVNAPSGNSGSASVTANNTSGGTDTDNTYSYTLSALTTSFFDYPGGFPTYATANTDGFCVNNLVAGQVYCFDYILPTSGTVTVDFVTNSSNCGSSGASQSGAFNGNNSTGLAGISTWHNECTLVNNGNFIWGTGAGQTAGDLYTCCYTAPAGCANMSFCPMINCSAGNCGDLVLPVELLYFAARPGNQEVLLNWATASELNNAYFTVERTLDGAAYQTVAQVQGAGTSHTQLYYQCADEAPVVGVSYYRLKQTDYNGKYKYSKPVKVSFDLSDYLSLYYDTNAKAIQLSVHTDSDNTPLSTLVSDALGNIVCCHKENCPRGNYSSKIDICNATPGIYCVRMDIGERSYFRKVVVAQ